MNKARQRKIEIAEAFRADLTENIHETHTRKDVQALLGKVINGVIQGFIKKDKAGPLALFLPLAYKVAKDLEGTESGRGFRVDMTETTKQVSVKMSEEQMDRYLSAPENVKLEILQSMQQEGSIKMIRRDDEVTISPGKVKPEDVKIDVEEIVKLSDKTDQPLTNAQAKEIFGKTLADAQEMKPGPDATGLGDLFEIKNKKPIGLPEGALHKWKGKYESNPGSTPPTVSLWFTCQQCGQRIANVNKELCPAGGKLALPG